MQSWRKFGLVALVFVGGCVPPYPMNILSVDPRRRPLGELGEARLWEERGGRLWLEVEAEGESAAVGGYYAVPEGGWVPFGAGQAGAGGLRGVVLLLDGASTYQPTGGFGQARYFCGTMGAYLRSLGYATWTLVLPEFKTAYGQADYAGALRAYRWLAGDGCASLGAEQFWVLGYSTGGTLALMLAREGDAAGVVAISGIADPQVVLDNARLYVFMSAPFPFNTGMSQMVHTLQHYTLKDRAAWHPLDSVGRADELRGRLLVIHGLKDRVFPAEHSLRLQAAVQRLAREATMQADVEFLLLEPFGHGGIHLREEVRAAVARFLAGGGSEPEGKGD